MPNKLFGIADPYYDALRVQSNQAIWPDAGGGSGSTGGVGLENKIYLWPTDGSTIAVFDPDQAGLIAALAAATSGDTVWLPSITISGNHTIPASVHVIGIDRAGSILTGAITLSAGSTLNNLTISRSGGASNVTCVIGPGSGTARVTGCNLIAVTTSGTPLVASAAIPDSLYLEDCYISARKNGAAVSPFDLTTGTLVDTWSIDSTLNYNQSGSYSTQLGLQYRVVVSGTINFRADSVSKADANFLTEDAWATHGAIFGWIRFEDSSRPISDSGIYESSHVYNFTRAGTGGMYGAMFDDVKYDDNSGSFTIQVYELTSSAINVEGCEFDEVVVGVPQWGDRGAWDALNYQARHANDIDDPAGIHHTLDALDARYDVAPADPRDYPVGWLPGWSYRIPISVANSDGTYTNKKVPVDVNTLPLVEAEQCNADLSDLRVTSSDGVSLLPFYRANEALLFNETNFARYASNPILPTGAGGSWESFWVQPSCVVDAGGGTLYMYYGGTDTSAVHGNPKQLGLATSTDGLTWTKYGSNPILSPGTAGAWDDEKAGGYVYVLKEGSNWYMWYTGVKAVDGNWQIGYATSSDGISWTKYGGNPVLTVGGVGTWDSFMVWAPSIMKIGSTYHMWYSGGSDVNSQSTWKIGHATSTDRVTWTKDAANPVLSGVASAWDDGVLDCDVKLIGDTYVMAYQGNVSGGSASAIGFAISLDGVSWTRRADNPFPKGAGGQWDDLWNEGPFLYRLGSQWLMYYMGAQGFFAPIQGGVMQFPDTRLWPIIPSLTSSGTTLFVYYGNSAATDVSTGSAGSPDANITVTDGAETTPDLAAWDDETQPAAHARDISDATYTYHLNQALNPNIGTFGSATQVSQITVDARGLITAASNVAITAGHAIQDEGTPLTSRANLNFVGTGVTATDDSGNNATVVTIPNTAPINVYNETATADGTNTTYYLINVAVAGTIRVYIDGIRQPASDDTSDTDVVTFSSIPTLGALLMFDYELSTI